MNYSLCGTVSTKDFLHNREKYNLKRAKLIRNDDV